MSLPESIILIFNHAGSFVTYPQLCYKGGQQDTRRIDPDFLGVFGIHCTVKSFGYQNISRILWKIPALSFDDMLKTVSFDRDIHDMFQYVSAKNNTIELYVEHKVDEAVLADEVIAIHWKNGGDRGSDIASDDSKDECDECMSLQDEVTNSLGSDSENSESAKSATYRSCDEHSVDNVGPKYDPKGSVPQWVAGLRFDSLKQFRHAVVWYSIVEKRNVSFCKSRSSRITVTCQGTCKFRICCSWCKRNNCFKIKNCYPEHSCSRSNVLRVLTSRVIAVCFRSRIMSAPDITVQEIRNLCKSEFKVNVSLYKCTRAKSLVLEGMDSDSEFEFGNLCNCAEKYENDNGGMPMKFNRISRNGQKRTCKKTPKTSTRKHSKTAKSKIERGKRKSCNNTIEENEEGSSQPKRKQPRRIRTNMGMQIGGGPCKVMSNGGASNVTIIIDSSSEECSSGSGGNLSTSSSKFTSTNSSF